MTGVSVATTVEARSSVREIASAVLGGLALFLVGGALAGLIWERVWTPPSGVAYQGKFALDGEGVQQAFSGTGLFVVVGLVAGVVLGLLTALWLRRTPLLGLAVSVVGAVAAALVMWLVGHLLGPTDPSAAAKTAEDFAALQGDLRVQGWSAFLALPAGTLAARLVAAVLIPGD